MIILVFWFTKKIKNNPKEAVLKIAEFLGEEFVLKLKENYDFILNKVIENSTIDSMKSNLDSVFGYSLDFLMRKGVVGDWRSHFIKEESD
jgi:hypothetical protein